MHYTYCLGVTNTQCGGVQDLILTPSNTVQTINTTNVLRSNSTMCYWGFKVNSSWSADTHVQIRVNTITGFYLSFAIGSSRDTAQTVLKYSALDQRNHTFRGNNQILYVLAFPFAGKTTNFLSISYSIVQGTYQEASTSPSFYEENKTLIVAVSSAGGGVIILGVVIFILVRWNRSRMINPALVKRQNTERSMIQSFNNPPYQNMKANVDDLALSGIPYNYKSNKIVPVGAQGNMIRLDNLMIDNDTMMDQDTQHKIAGNPYGSGSDQRFQPTSLKNLVKITYQFIYIQKIDHWAKNVPQPVTGMEDYVPTRRK
ncbi:UNKNOWN [Stylonychia lemnae]|uniref:CUB domain-containing protein n=1 Tax=Stylonychia lemnae TaxID=5949 RepID=A0A078AAN1_STYLE|nr:UNKNOWN [Stylonychia lemnae]|eukprot:CDW79274.1 UNKNOWN [Stylonychia lemnae]